MRKIFLAGIIIFFVAAGLKGSDNRSFVRLTPEDGLSQRTVRCILQDKFGFMWFGTKEGLNRFDGYTFKIYKYDITTKNSLLNSTINDIYEEENGNFIICTGSGVNIYNREKDNFEVLNFIPITGVNCVIKDSRLNYWFGTDNGLYLFNCKDSTVKLYQNIPDNPKSLSNSLVKCILEDSKHNIWVGTQQGLNLLDKTDSTFSLLRNKQIDIINNYTIKDLKEDNSGRIWIAASAGGLNVYTFPNHKPTDGTLNHITNGNAIELIIDRQNKLWIGYGAGGGLKVLNLSAYSANKIELESYINIPGNDKSLSDNSIESIYQDRLGDLWIGTYGKGINYFSTRTKQFHSVIQDLLKDFSLSNYMVNSFLEDERYLWIGTEIGLNRLEKSTGIIKHYLNNPANPKSIGANAVYALFKDSKGILWVGTWNGGLNRYNPVTDDFTVYKNNINDPKSISNNHVFSIYEDSRKNLWVGTIGGGLNKFDYLTGTFSHYRLDRSNSTTIGDDFVCAILEVNNELWISTYRALNRFDYNTNTFEHFSHNPDEPMSLSNGDIEIIFNDSKGNIWLGTEAGLDYFDRKNKTFRHFRVSEGLANNAIKSILEDDNGNLWVSTNFGISKLINAVSLPDTVVITNYNYFDGLQGNEFIKRSAFKASNGSLYFGGTNGYTWFFPDSIFENNITPPVLITDFQLFNVSVIPDGKILKKNIILTDRIVLSHKQSVFSIEFTALNYLNANKNEYTYMLEGFDKDWRRISTKRIATYTNLNPGKYIFKVKGSNNDGKWNNNPASLEIVILPPWWKTLWFKIAVIIFLIATITIFYFYRVYSLQKQKIILESMVRQRTTELSEANAMLEEGKEEITRQNEELASHRSNLEALVIQRTIDLQTALKKAEDSDKLKSAFLANLSHEIRTPMNAIMGFSNLILEDNPGKKERDNFLQLIYSNCESLLHVINNIVEISIIESDLLKINKDNFNVDTVLRELENTYRNQNTKNIIINYTNKIVDDQLTIYNDKLRFRQVFSKLLDNALKFTESGSIDFGYSIEHDCVKFFVSDTGIGIQNEQLNLIFNHFHKVEKSEFFRGTGVGLTIAKKITELMGGQMWIESEIKKGSTVYFSLPPGKHVDQAQTGNNIFQKINFTDLHTITLLIAEDEPTNYYLLYYFLTSRVKEILWAQNGLEAVKLCEENINNQNLIVLMDIKMPVMNGFEAFERIKELRPDIPVIAVTAFAGEDERRQVLEKGFLEYLPKPIDKSKLLDILTYSIK